MAQKGEEMVKRNRRFARTLSFVGAVVLVAVFALAGAAYAAPRTLAVTQPNGGEVFEPGQVASVHWSCEGNWQAGDTIRLEYSSNGGSIWNPLPNAASLPYSDLSYNWDTTGYADSTGYRIRAANDRFGLSDVSDGDFELRTHTIPPAINHTPFTQAGSVTGPYQIRAVVTDDHGVSAVRVRWNKNGGVYVTAQMTATGLPNEYSYSIPGPSYIGDSYCYYIEATDNAPMLNTAKYPADAPASTCCFEVTGCGTDSAGSIGSGSYLLSGYLTGNIVRCDRLSILTGIEQYLDVPNGSNLTFCVLRMSASPGYSTKIYEVSLTGVGHGLGWYSSGPMAVDLEPGWYYAVAAGAAGQVRSYDNSGTPFPTGTLFGQGVSGCSLVYPPADNPYIGEWGTLHFSQRLSTCVVSRKLALVSPNGGQLVEPGETVPIAWTHEGVNWQTADALRLEYSTDSGSVWTPISGAQNLPHDAATFNWDTTGLPDSTHYRVRAVLCGHDDVSDSSDADFELRTHLAPPVIPHTPLVDTGNYKGPYTISAEVTDDHGVQAATLYWSRNGGALTAVSMTRSGTTNTYSASIAGPASAGDQFSYYIEAVDGSPSHNASAYPAEAPGSLVSFTITSCYTDVGGGAVITNGTYTGQTYGNSFLCTDYAELTGIEQYLNLEVSGEMRLVVWESDTAGGPYRQIHCSALPARPAGAMWHSSGPISVLFVPGRYYVVAAGSPRPVTYYRVSPISPIFGSFRYGCFTTYPPPDPATFTSVTVGGPVYFAQRLTTCRPTRALAVTGPIGGRVFERGAPIAVQLSAVGSAWDPADTIRLECSADSGATWSQITGAEALPYNTTSYTWNTAGLAGSDHYRLKATFNGDGAVSDTSDADFAIVVDTVGPTITHTPLADIGGSATCYVSALASDDRGVAGAKLYCRTNGGSFRSYVMSVSSAGYCSYSLDVSGVHGDVFDYYIEATDKSLASNVSREPAVGYHSFAIVDGLTERFGNNGSIGGPFDLSYTSVVFTPDGSREFYSVCTKPILALPTDPTGGTTLPLSDNSFAEVALADGAQVLLYGQPWSSFFVGSNGYVTFGAGDTAYTESASAHFSRKRISGLFHDLCPSPSGSVSYKQMADRVAVTYSDVGLYSLPGTVTFQIEMLFDGTIALSYLNADAINNASYRGFCGLSKGVYLAGWYASNFSLRPACSVAALEATDSVAPTNDNSVPFGTIAVGSSRSASVTIRNTGASDIIIDEIKPALLSDDFSDGLAQGWEATPSDKWSASTGEYVVEGARLGLAESFYTGALFDNFRIEARVSPSDTANLVARYTKLPTGNANAYVFSVGPYEYYIYRILNGIYAKLGHGFCNPSSWPDWTLLAADLDGSTLRFYINRSLVATAVDTTLQSGQVGIQAFSASCAYAKCRFDDVLVTPLPGSSVPGFTVTGTPTLPLALRPGESRDVTVTYSPTSAGNHKAFLAVRSRGANNRTLSVSLTGGAANPDSIAAAKRLGDIQPVGIAGGKVSAVLADRFYIQNDYLSGIGVLWAGTMPLEGSAVNVFGSMTTLAGERVISADSVSQ